MIPQYSSGAMGSTMFPDPNNTSIGTLDRSNANIWANTASGVDPRAASGPDGHRLTWGSYTPAQHGDYGHHQSTWGYQHMRDPSSHTGWGGNNEHEQWKYSRSQSGPAPPPPPGPSVWQYPGSSGHPNHEYHHDWSGVGRSGMGGVSNGGMPSMNGGPPQAPPQQATSGYYYVSSSRHHDHPQHEDYIPYDIGSRSYMMQGGGSPGSYPIPAHMRYYAGQQMPPSAYSAATSPQVVTAGGSSYPGPSANPISNISPSGNDTSKLNVSPPVPKGAASFLFEAAAAAAASAAMGQQPSLLPSSNKLPDNQVLLESKELVSADKTGVGSPKSSTEVTGGRRWGGGSSVTGGAGESAATGGSIHDKLPVNGSISGGVSSGGANNHTRLHANRTNISDKVPLVSNSGQGNSVTTLMIRNIPNRYMQSELLAEIKEAGFDNKFDFFYLPMDHETHANFGYAFINFIDDRSVDPFTKRFNGLKLNRFTSNKIIQIVPAQLQGFQANLQHYCKKAVCTDDNVDYRPLFFVDGKCLEFHRASEFAASTAAAAAAEQAAAGMSSSGPKPILSGQVQSGGMLNRGNGGSSNPGDDMNSYNRNRGGGKGNNSITGGYSSGKSFQRRPQRQNE